MFHCIINTQNKVDHIANYDKSHIHVSNFYRLFLHVGGFCFLFQLRTNMLGKYFVFLRII